MLASTSVLMPELQDDQKSHEQAEHHPVAALAHQKLMADQHEQRRDGRVEVNVPASLRDHVGPKPAISPPASAAGHQVTKRLQAA